MIRKKLKILSLFDGISGAQAALAKLGVAAEYYAVEIDDYAIRIAMKNFPETVQLGNVLQFFADPENVRLSPMQNLDRLPKDIALLIAGFPCQGLSVANNTGKGLEDPRSFLFYAFLRILEYYFETQTKPFYFVGENVESMKTKDFVVITNALGVEPVMLDAGIVSAQRRKRYFWTNIPGVKKPHLVRSKIFPENKIGLVIADILEPDALRRLVEIPKEKLIRTKYGVRWNGYGTGDQSQKAVSVENKGFTIDSGIGGKYAYRIATQPQSQCAQATSEKDFSLVASKTHHKALIVNDRRQGLQGRQAFTPDCKMQPLDGQAGRSRGRIVTKAVPWKPQEQSAQTTDQKMGPLCAGRTLQKSAIVKDHNSEQFRAISWGEKHGTLAATRLTSKTTFVFEDLQIEQLTWTEIERLAGLPDGYTDLGEDNRVEHRGRAIGNGFQIDIVAHLLSFMLSFPEPVKRSNGKLRGEQIYLF